MGRILIIEDDNSLREQLRGWIEEMGHEAICSSFRTSGFYGSKTLLLREEYDFAILEGSIQFNNPFNKDHDLLRREDPNKISAFLEFILPILKQKVLPPPPYFIIISRNGSSTEASYAINNGALDYIQIPLDMISDKESRLNPEKMKDRILKRIAQGFALIEKKEEIAKIIDGLKYKNIIGKSKAIRICQEELTLSLGNDFPVLITGETGTGKELLASGIHYNSVRKDNKFVRLNCAAFTETMFETELFGAKKGAATGIINDITGKMKEADKGTLFLDEIGELALPIQAKLLRAIQEKKFYRLGDPTEKNSDYRLITATNRDLQKMVRDGLFREDLLFRINKLTIKSPPLRERLSDINLLIRHYLKENKTFGTGNNANAKYNISEDPEFIKALMEYSWPGNIRELFNIIGEATMKAGSDKTLQVYHLPSHILSEWGRKAYDREDDTVTAYFRRLANKEDQKPKESNDSLNADYQMPEGLQTLKKHESINNEKYFGQLMEITNGNVKEIARLSGKSEKTIYYHLKKNNIPTRITKKRKK